MDLYDGARNIGCLGNPFGCTSYQHEKYTNDSPIATVFNIDPNSDAYRAGRLTGDVVGIAVGIGGIVKGAIKGFRAVRSLVKEWRSVAKAADDLPTHTPANPSPTNPVKPTTPDKPGKGTSTPKGGSNTGSGAKGGSSNGSGSPIPGVQVPKRAVVSPKTVYRSDMRHPSEIFRSGFKPRPEGSNMDLVDYHLNNTSSTWVGTSTSEYEASMFPQGGKGAARWVYEIASPGTGISMNRALSLGVRLRYGFGSEREVIFSEIDPSTIVRAVRWKPGQKLPEVIENPDYRGPQ